MEKWFYPVQQKVTKYLRELYATHQCDWQDIVEKDGIVYERYSGITKKNSTFCALLITITKQSMDFHVYVLKEDKQIDQ